MKKLHWAVMTAGILGSVALCGTDASADGPQNQINWGVDHNGVADSHLVSIVRPFVDRPSYDTGIPIWAGDRIFVHAGGCAQTGGKGKTWKRYVNPDTQNNLYYGEIAIPGTQAEGLTPLRWVVGPDGTFQRELTATTQGFAFGTVQLGYVDDAYGDNGYWGPDGGTNNQCVGQPDAWVDLYICRSWDTNCPVAPH